MPTNFITTAYLKENLAIQSTVNSDLLTPFIQAAQRMYILPILGTSQYDALLNDVDNYSLTGLTGTSSALAVAIRPCLEYYTFYTAMPYIQSKFTNKGIVQLEDQNATPVDEIKFDKLRKDVFSWAQFEQRELLRFLRKNRTTYPLWREDYFSQFELNSGSTYSRTFFGGIEFDSSIEWRIIPPDILS